MYKPLFKSYPKRLAIVTCGITALLAASFAGATDGLSLNANGAVQHARAGAGSAAPVDAHAVIVNPASLLTLGRRMDAALDILHPDISFRPNGVMGNPLAGEMRAGGWNFVPQFALSHPLSDRYSIGIGLHTINGMNVDFPSSRNILSALLHGNADRRLGFMHQRLSLAAATRVSEHWSLGAALNINYQRLRTDHLTLRLKPSQARNEWDDTWGTGYSLSALGTFNPVNLSISYTSRQWMGEFDRYGDLLRDSADLPESIHAGAAWHAGRKTTIMADYKYYNWSALGLGKAPLRGGFGWKSQHVGRVAISRQFSERLDFHTGYSLGTSPIDDRHTFINVLAPGAGTQHMGAGAVYKTKRGYELSFAYLYGPRNSLTESGKGDLFSQVGKGTRVAASLHSISFGVGRAF